MSEPSTNPRTQAKNRWLAKCRADPEKAQHLKELRRKYYEKNIERERAAALERYYKRVGAAWVANAALAIVPPVSEPPVSEPPAPPAPPA